MDINIETILKLENDIIYYNEQYRIGNSLISDAEYDKLVDKLREYDINHELLSKIGYINTTDNRKVKLPYPMFSMDKLKNIEELTKWVNNRDYISTSELIITPKYDGASFLANEKSGEGWTRGDGTFGQKSDKHFNYINGGKLDKKLISFGEMIMRKDIFEDKYSEIFKNPRNMIAGLLNSKDISDKKDMFNDVDFIRYGIFTDNELITKKSQELDVLNKYQQVQVPYILTNANNITIELIQELFDNWNTDYEIDGIIIEINDYKLRKELGRENNNNPAYARAFKGEFEETKLTKVLNIDYQISRTGKLKPVVYIDPIKLNGVTVKKATGNNAKYMKDNNIGIGSIIIVKRSGMVIPKIINVITPTGFVMPDIENIYWDDNKVDLMMGDISNEQEIKQIAHFFKSIKVTDLGEGICKMLYTNGLTTIKKILTATKFDLIKIPGIGEKNAIKIIRDVNNKLKNIPIHILQNASGLFTLLGEKKLKLINHFNYKPNMEELLLINGIGEKNAEIYLDNYDNFIKFANELNINFIIPEKEEIIEGKLNGIIICFTKIRDKELENYIFNNGGQVVDSITNECTHLVCKDINENSSKLKKAKQKEIKILNLEQFKQEIYD